MTTTPPDWAVMVPSTQAIHQIPATSADQLEAPDPKALVNACVSALEQIPLVADLLNMGAGSQTTNATILQTLNGAQQWADQLCAYVTPTPAGSTTPTTVTDALNQIQTLLNSWPLYNDIVSLGQTLVTDTNNLVQDVINGLNPWAADLLAFLGNPANMGTDLFNAEAQATAWINSLITSAEAVINAFVNSWLGLNGSGVNYAINDLIRAIESIPSSLMVGTLSPGQASHATASILSPLIPQYLDNPNFDTANSIIGQSIWTWDGTQGPPGTSTSVYTTANGSVRELYSNTIHVAPLLTNLAISAYTKWTGFSGGTIALTVAKFDINGVLLGYDTIQTITSPGAAGGWTQLAGTYLIPNNVWSIAVRPMVGADASAGQVWFGEMSCKPSSNIVLPQLIAQLDATAIATGQFAQSMVTGLTTLFGGLTSSTTLTSQLGANNIGDLQSVINGIINSFAGSLLGAVPMNQTSANTAMSNLFSSMTQNAQQLQALVQTNSDANSYGVYDQINFSALPNSSTLPTSLFTSTYSGPGTSVCGVNNGLAHWTTNGDGGTTTTPRRGIFIFTPTTGSAVTATDYQRLGATVNGGPTNWNGQSAANYGFARVDTASNPQNYVYCKVTTNGVLGFFVELGCVVGGVVHNPSSTIPWGASAGFPYASNFWLLAGVGNNPRRFQVLAGNQIAIDYTEPTTGTGFPVSQLGAGFRHWGFGGDVTGGGGYSSPADILSGSVTDNAPAAVKGSSFRVYRGTTTTVSTGGAVTSPAASHFDTVDYASADYPASAWDGTNLTIGVEGTHLFHVRYNISGMIASQASAPTLYRTRSGTQTLIRQMGGAFSDVAGDVARGLDGSAMVYCQVGDIITPGYTVSGATSFTGEITGTTSYFEAALLNLSYN